jgi:hypothetical protein
VVRKSGRKDTILDGRKVRQTRRGCPHEVAELESTNIFSTLIAFPQVTARQAGGKESKALDSIGARASLDVHSINEKAVGFLILQKSTERLRQMTGAIVIPASGVESQAYVCQNLKQLRKKNNSSKPTVGNYHGDSRRLLIPTFQDTGAVRDPMRLDIK